MAAVGNPQKHCPTYAESASSLSTPRRTMKGCRPIVVRLGRGAADMSAASALPIAQTTASARIISRCATPTPTTSIPDAVFNWLKDLIASDVRFVTQNGLYDWGWLRADGDILMPPADRLEEIGALATLVDENRFQYSLDALCAWRGLPGKDTTLLQRGGQGRCGFAIEAQEDQCRRRTSGSCRRIMSAPMPRPMRRTPWRCGRTSIRSSISEGTRDAYRLEVDLCRWCTRCGAAEFASIRARPSRRAI